MQSSPLIEWFNAQVVPLLDAFNAGDLDRARRAHCAAAATLDAEPDPDARAAKAMRLAAAWVTVLRELGDAAGSQAVLTGLVAAWAGPQPGPQSALVAPVTELMTRLYHDARGWLPLAEPEARALIAAVPEPARGGNYWHSVACWAFKHQRLDLLELALAHFSSAPPPRQQAWLYYSTRLMYRLREHVALPQDLADAVSAITSRPELQELERALLTECRHQGLVTPEMEALLRSKSAALGAE
jgi:hypothetical protein